MYELFIGIDPGGNGAVAVLTPDGAPVDCFEVPFLKDGSRKTINTRALSHRLQVLTKGKSVFCAIERVNAMPKQGVSSTFAFRRAFGQLEGVASAFGWSLIHVRPKTWQKKFFQFASGSDTKEKSRQIAMGLFPKVDLHLKKHHNKADSLLIGEYGRRYQKMEES